MQQLITAKQAKQITRGRTPLVPVQYEAALNALSECISLDDAKVWSDKADALAAWAKIYRSDDVNRKAKMLKLHAYRRMGQLASEIRPATTRNKPGPNSVLLESGLNSAQSRAALQIARTSERTFKKVVNADEVPSPSTFYLQSRSPTSARDEGWDCFAYGANSAMSFRSFCRRYPAARLARSIGREHAESARALATELTEWLDEFEQALSRVTA